MTESPLVLRGGSATGLFPEVPEIFQSIESPPKRQAPRKPPQALRPGDPVCWSWPPFRYRRNLSPQKAELAFRAWHKGRCGICSEVPRLLVLDHDHQTGLARGLLCDDCNKAEGAARAKDDVFARWRAVPTAAILGIAFVYVSTARGVADPMPFKVTGPVFLPEWAPEHYPWPPESALVEDADPSLFGRPHRPTGPDPSVSIESPLQVWLRMSADQRTAVRVCFPDLAAALEANA